jgi:anti-sigma B factor antagonist
MTDHRPLSIRVETGAGNAVVLLDGELDAFTAPEFTQTVEQVLESGLAVSLDMDSVTFMDSSGLRALLTVAAGAPASFRSVRINSASEQVRRLLSITGLDEHFLVG